MAETPQRLRVDPAARDARGRACVAAQHPRDELRIARVQEGFEPRDGRRVEHRGDVDRVAQACWIRLTKLAALSESPPSAKKSSSTPIRSIAERALPHRRERARDRCLRRDVCGALFAGRRGTRLQRLGQPVALQLATRRPRDRLQEVHDARDLEVREALVRMADQLVLRDGRAGLQHHGGGDLLAQRQMRQRERRGLRHGRMREQRVVDFVRRDLFAAPVMISLMRPVGTGSRPRRDSPRRRWGTIRRSAWPRLPSRCPRSRASRLRLSRRPRRASRRDRSVRPSSTTAPGGTGGDPTDPGLRTPCGNGLLAIMPPVSSSRRSRRRGRGTSPRPGRGARREARPRHDRMKRKVSARSRGGARLRGRRAPGASSARTASTSGGTLRATGRTRAPRSPTSHDAAARDQRRRQHVDDAPTWNIGSPCRQRSSAPRPRRDEVPDRREQVALRRAAPSRSRDVVPDVWSTSATSSAGGTAIASRALSRSGARRKHSGLARPRRRKARRSVCLAPARPRGRRSSAPRAGSRASARDSRNRSRTPPHGRRGRAAPPRRTPTPRGTPSRARGCAEARSRRNRRAPARPVQRLDRRVDERAEPRERQRRTPRRFERDGVGASVRDLGEARVNRVGRRLHGVASGCRRGRQLSWGRVGRRRQARVGDPRRPSTAKSRHCNAGPDIRNGSGRACRHADPTRQSR